MVQTVEELLAEDSEEYEVEGAIQFGLDDENNIVLSLGPEGPVMVFSRESATAMRDGLSRILEAGEYSSLQ